MSSVRQGAGAPPAALFRVPAARDSPLVAVAGTHGKSTSAGWLMHVLADAGRDPSGFVGALLPATLSGGIPATARWGGGDTFLVEADEYAGNFAPYRPSLAVLLNAEWDHPDVFANEAAVLDAFEAWLRAMAAGTDGGPPTLVANVGDPGAGRVVERLGDWPGRVVRVALDGVVDIRGRLVAGEGGRGRPRGRGPS